MEDSGSMFANPEQERGMEMMLTSCLWPPVKSVAAINLASAVPAYLVRWYFRNRPFGLSGIVRLMSLLSSLHASARE